MDRRAVSGMAIGGLRLLFIIGLLFLSALPAKAQWSCAWMASEGAEVAALKLLEEKNYNKAVSVTSKAVKLSPTNARVYNIRGQAYLEKGKYDKAIADFTKAIDIVVGLECVPVDFSADYGNMDDALLVYRSAIHVKAYTLRAAAYDKKIQSRKNKGDDPAVIADKELLRKDRERIQLMANDTLPKSKTEIAEERRQAHKRAQEEWAAISAAEQAAKADAERASQEYERLRQEQELEIEKRELAKLEQTMQTLKELENDYFALVEGGAFTMGCTKEQGKDCENNEKPAHKVTVGNFYIGKYEVTQRLWEAVTGSNPSKFLGDSLPVEQINMEDVQDFIAELNRLTEKNYRLPTEAEWEFAARGGNKSMGYKYSGGNIIEDVAWYSGNNGSLGTGEFRTKPVGGKQANELGIYDMSGNVFEWVSDVFGNYGASAVTNPTGPQSGPSRVYRGGSCGESAENCRVSKRRDSTPDNHSFDLGFRLALDP